MKTLLVLRHAKSSWGNQFQADHDRPLNDRGKKAAPRMGRWLASLDLTPQLIITSTATRALTTAELVAIHSGYAAELRVESRFYLADPATYLHVLHKSDVVDERVMVVGHNPGMEQLVEQLTGRSTGMPTAALAHIELPIENWAELKPSTKGKLQGYWVPGALPEDFE